MALLKFLKGNYAGLSAKAISEGQVLICGDTGEMFVDVASDKRVKIGDFVVVSDIQALEALDASSVPTSRLYYVENGNILARSDGTSWTQINKQKTLAQLGGVSLETYNTKMAALETADTNNSTAISNLSTYVGTIPETAEATNIVAYVQEKTAGIATDTALEELTGRVAGAETDIDNLQAAIAEGGSVAKAIAEAKKAGTDAQATADSKATLDDVKALDYATKTEAQGYANAKDEAIAAAQKAGDDAQADVDALELKVGTIEEGKTVAGLISDAQTTADNAQTAVETLSGKVGTVPADKTVVQMISEAQSAATYNDTEVRGLISDNAADIKAIADDYLKKADKEALQGNIDTVSGKVTTLIGEDANKSVRTIANEELAKQLIAEDASESLDTLAEIAAWIQSHPDDASAMNEAIVALQKQLQGIDAGEGTVKKYVDDAITALNVGQYALAADLTTLAGRVSALETASATHALKTEVKAVSDALDEYKTAHNGDYTNTQIDAAIDADVKVVADDLKAYKEAHTSDYTNKQIDDAIANAGHASASDLADHIADTVSHVTTDDKAKWNAAQANAEATAASALATARTEITAEIDADVKAEADRAKGIESGLQSAIDTINNAENGILAQAKSDATSKANAAQAAAEKTASDALTAALTWGSF